MLLFVLLSCIRIRLTALGSAEPPHLQEALQTRRSGSSPRSMLSYSLCLSLRSDQELLEGREGTPCPLHCPLPQETTSHVEPKAEAHLRDLTHCLLPVPLQVHPHIREAGLHPTSQTRKLPQRGSCFTVSAPVKRPLFTLGRSGLSPNQCEAQPTEAVHKNASQSFNPGAAHVTKDEKQKRKKAEGWEQHPGTFQKVEKNNRIPYTLG